MWNYRVKHNVIILLLSLTGKYGRRLPGLGGVLRFFQVAFARVFLFFLHRFALPFRRLPLTPPGEKRHTVLYRVLLRIKGCGWKVSARLIPLAIIHRPTSRVFSCFIVIRVCKIVSALETWCCGRNSSLRLEQINTAWILDNQIACNACALNDTTF